MRVDGVTGTAVPVEIAAVGATGAPVTSVGTFLLNNLYVAITRVSDGFGWDFADSTFKAVPTTPQSALVEVSVTKYPGLCHLAGGWTYPAGEEDTYQFTISQVGVSAVPVANVPLVWTMFVGTLVGDAVLGSNLVDDLVPVADELREELHADFGVRQFAVKQIRKFWSGTRGGLGAARIDYVRELVPSPRVQLVDHHHHELAEGGLQEVGMAVLTEISLTYSESQLIGGTHGDLIAREEFYWRFDDKLGQGVVQRVYIPQDHPFPDREKDIGWMIKLRRDDARNVVR